MLEKFLSEDVKFLSFQQLPVLELRNKFCTARISPYGAHVLSCRFASDPADLLMVSRESAGEPGKPVRGGVPICLPHFGSVAQPLHGTARLQMWEVKAIDRLAEGSTRITLTLPVQTGEGVLLAEYRAEFGRSLVLSLTCENPGTVPITFSEALHTYFSVKDIRNCRISGLDGASGMDTTLEKDNLFVQHGDIVIDREVDCRYRSTGTVEIVDPGFRRKIVIEKSNSENTVVWNPWIAKSQRMADFGNEEYIGMVCVEAVNAPDVPVTLRPGEKHTLTQSSSILSL